MKEQKENHKTILYPEIASELVEMRRVDQEMLHNIGNGGVYDPEVNRKNTARLKELITQIGWPTLSKVGEQGMHSAWLIAQHADEDVAFQRECLELMMQESPEEVKQGDIAYLEDRVRVAEKRPQLYGTQFFTNESGIFGPKPIEDREHLDERRASVGLQPMAEYEARMMMLHGKKIKE